MKPMSGESMLGALTTSGIWRYTNSRPVTGRSCFEEWADAIALPAGTAKPTWDGLPADVKERWERGAAERRKRQGSIC
jgi:hypothetical protein